MGVPIAHRMPHVPGQRVAYAAPRSKASRTATERFHDLRHTFATMALQNGVDVKTVSSMLGHYSAGFTLDTYAHVTTDAQLKAAQTMGSILSRAV
jgi:integrase